MMVTGDRRVRGGEYDDSPSAYYSWDSTVSRSEDPRPGDGVVLWDGDVLLGTSVIDGIDRGTADKVINSCARCGAGRIKLRKVKKPRFRCDPCGAEFDDPATEVASVKTYRARYAAGWIDLPGGLTGDQLRAMTDSPKSQHAIRPIDLGRFWAALGKPRVTPFEAALGQWVRGGHTNRVARVRLGQPGFRKGLLGRFGAVCAFTGPGPQEALEAAHLYSYARSGKHDLYGGWLMRRDLHSLFDVGHVAVHPVSLTIDVTPDVRRYAAYGALHGGRLHVKADVQHRKWLDLHWARNR